MDAGKLRSESVATGFLKSNYNNNNTIIYYTAQNLVWGDYFKGTHVRARMHTHKHAHTHSSHELITDYANSFTANLNR